MYIDLRKHKFIDALIYKVSRGKSIIDSVAFKYWLFKRKTDYVSNLNPIIIGGCPRSGTTLARALIGIHPEIASPEKEYNTLMWIRHNDILRNMLDFTSEEDNTLKTRYRDHVRFAENVL